MATSMSEVVRAVRHALDAHDLHYDFDSENSTFRFSLRLNKTKLASVDILILCNTDDSGKCVRITSYGMISIRADEDCMFSMAEFLHRANFGLPYGCFELDFRDGEIRFRMSVNANEAIPSNDAIDDLIVFPANFVNMYGDGILAVSMGIMTPEEAVVKCEGD